MKNYDENEKAIIWLTSFDFVHYSKISQILSLFSSPKEMKDRFQDKEVEIKKIVGEDHYSKMVYAENSAFLQNYLSALEKQGIFVLTSYSKGYPEKLRQVDCPPYILFLKGDRSLLDTRTFGVVGTRKPTAYGRKVTEVFTKDLAENGLTIVSGLAYGIDGMAHETTLSCSGKTIAVLGSGFNYIYPATHSNLAKQISERGLLVSEYKPSAEPQKYTFIERNRIIAGLSEGILIPEAGITSGSLRTKEYALDTGREVFCVPGNIFNSESEGTNHLIKTAPTICCVTSPEDILERLGIAKGNKTKKADNVQLSLDEEIIIGVLRDGEISFQSLSDSSGFDTKKLNSCLTSLQIRGLIRKLPGNKYSL